MSQSEKTRLALEAKVGESLAGGNIEELQQVAGAWKVAAEIEKLELEADNVRKSSRSETVRFWVGVLVPMAGAIAVVGTLLFQIYQLRQNVVLQTQANEATEFRDVIKNAQLPPWLAADASTTRLKSFLSHSEYKQQARDMAILLLGAISNQDSFQFLYAEVKRTSNRDNFPDLVRLSRELNSLARGASERLAAQKQSPTGSRRAKSSRDGTSQGPPTADQVNQMYPPDSPEEVASITQELIVVGSDIGAFLAGFKPPMSDVDLSGAMLYYVDLSGLDLSRANLTGTGVQQTVVKDVDFGKVTKFEQSLWYNTAWWRARRISPSLLSMLKTYYPFDPAKNYFNDDTTAQDQYRSAVNRLEHD